MAPFDHTRFAPAITPLLDGERVPDLGPGTPDRSALDRLRALTAESVTAPAPVRDRDAASACLAGLWLLYDFLDESHTISQGLHTPDGSYWHAIMHRREGDFGNSKYWLRRVGAHPIFAPLAAAARGLASDTPDAPGVFTAEAWDPFAFVDLCEVCVNGSSPYGDLCRRVQRREWELLFERCYQQASGA
jgi:hypothetical protein